MLGRLIFLTTALVTSASMAQDGPAQSPHDFPTVINTQPLGESPTTAIQAAQAMGVPQGFQVTLFAGEPDVNQPISMSTDDRGRLWVVECYTYAERGYDERFRDRILILEDTTGDGIHDTRKVFWDQGLRLTSALVGHGGVWILNNGALQRLKDEDQDDRADPGEVETLLEGFAKDRAQHNIVNGLMWGPDGWLYGRHGITASSTVGRLVDNKDQRTQLNCSIWRYHPVTTQFEVVTHGTTNPWGMDYNDFGEMFFTNNVIGHLWHVVPGAHYKRMFGEDFNPHLYELIDQTADHYHWDNQGGNWTASRDAKGKHDELGGGHSHCGGMIYLGDRWPSEYRNRIFMCNTHGRRVNQNILQRDGCSYIGRTAPDFAMANNPWFRGVDLKYGPDGDVYLSDWTDLGECHDNDGVHRTSGRIYKITYGKPLPRPKLLDQPLHDRTDLELVQLMDHSNDWFVRRARRILQERAAAGAEMKEVNATLRKQIQSNPDITRRLRALWALHATSGDTENLLLDLLKDKDEAMRSWAVRLLTEASPNLNVTNRLAELAADEPSGLVRLYLAAALQRISHRSDTQVALKDGHEEAFWKLAAALAEYDDAKDRVQPLMIWYGIEQAVADQPQQAIDLLGRTKIPLLRRHIARRLTARLEREPEAADAMLNWASSQGPAIQRDILDGMAAALRGWRKAPRPEHWTAFRKSLPGDPALQQIGTELTVVFGDGREMAALRTAITDAKRDTAERRNALRVLLESQPEGFAPELHKLLADRSLNDLAVAGLAQYDHPETAAKVLGRFGQMRPPTRTQAISTLASRKSYAVALLKAVERGQVDRTEISADQARQMAALEDDQVTQLLEKVWGAIRTTPAEKTKLLHTLKAELTPESLAKADLHQGHQLFTQHCGSCHRLFGEGKSVAPDLTGGNRDNLHYLLHNIVDPSAVVPVAFRTSAMRLKDGRVINGVVTRSEGPVFHIQTAKEAITVPKDEVAEQKQSELSLMPDNLTQLITREQLRDLIAYLQRKQPLPPSPPR